MLKLIVCLVAVASAVPQGPPAGPPPAAPEWFLREGLTGSFSERTAVCIEEANSTPQLPTLILIPENNKAEICINFPPRTLSDGRQLKGGWRHDIGRREPVLTTVVLLIHQPRRQTISNILNGLR